MITTYTNTGLLLDRELVGGWSIFYDYVDISVAKTPPSSPIQHLPQQATPNTKPNRDSVHQESANPH